MLMDIVVELMKDGNDRHCFIQLKGEVLPTVPKSTVESWLRELNIQCTRCIDKEHNLFKKTFPPLTRAFGKISTTDQEKLKELSQHKKPKFIA